MATNTFSKADWVAMDTLRLFKLSTEIFGGMSHDYVSDYQKEFAVGDTVRVKYPWRPTVRTGSFTYAAQNITRTETTVTVDQPIGVDFEWETVDKLLNMERGEERVRKEYLRPAALYMAAEADKQAALFAYQNTGNITGVLGTNPTTFDATSAAARQRFAELGSMSDDKGIYIPPSVMRAIKGGTDANLTRFGPVEDIKKLYRKGVVGTADDFEWSESMTLATHTAGTITAPVLASAPANGATSLSITATIGNTLNKGDVLGIAGVFRVNPVTRERTESVNTMTVTVAADVTFAAATTVVTIVETLNFSGNYQNIDAQPAAAAVLTLFPGTTSPNGLSGKQGLAFTREAFAAISLPLPMPKKEELVSQATDPDTGLSISFIRSFDAVNRRWINRFDALFGFGRLHADLAAMRILCS